MQEMKARNLIQAIIERFSGQPGVQPGDIAVVTPDRLLAYDTYLPDIESYLNEVGGRAQYVDKVVITFDHAVPPSTSAQAKGQADGLAFVRRQGFRFPYPFEGICHQLMAEHGHFLPGSLVAGTDSHIPAAGAFGALGMAVSPLEAVEVLVTGKSWMQVPEVAGLEINGDLPTGVCAKDLSLFLLGLLGKESVPGKAVMLFGHTVERLGIDGRLTVCIMLAESGCFSALMPPNKDVWEFLRTRLDEEAFRRLVEEFGKLGKLSEVGAQIHADCSQLSPQVAVPFSPSNAHNVSEVEGERITQAFIGSCAGGRYEDLVTAAQVLRGKTVHPGVRLIVIPASREIAIRAIRSGVLAVFYEVGAMVLNPGCGLCGGFHQGLLADGDVMVSTQTRNYRGRSGTPNSRIFLASSATVAASAIEGVICDPRKFLGTSLNEGAIQ